MVYTIFVINDRNRNHRRFFVNGRFEDNVKYSGFENIDTNIWIPSRVFFFSNFRTTNKSEYFNNLLADDYKLTRRNGKF